MNIFILQVHFYHVGQLGYDAVECRLTPNGLNEGLANKILDAF